MRVTALDLSLTATGVVRPSGDTAVIKPKGRGVQRLDFYARWIRSAVVPASEVVMLEDYAFHGRNAHSHELGELGGVVRLVLFQAELPFVPVVPSSLKLYATGKGNAPKELMLAEAIRRLGYEGADHNEADALWLWQMAMRHYGDPRAVAMPAKNTAALEKVPWPDAAVMA